MKSFAKKIKQVDPQKYDKEYFESVYSIYDFSQKIDIEDKEDFCWSISELAKLTKEDTIIDFGCGVGHLSFYLYLKYGCKIIGTDYAKDAIFLSNKNKKNFLKAHNITEDKIKFLHSDNYNLPTFKNIKVVYLQDVIEHLYDEEIDMLLTKFKTWNDKKIYIAIRTDNNLYIRYVRPLIDLFSVITKKGMLKDLKERLTWEEERHINLMTVNQVKRKLLKQGFVTEKVEYATLNYEKVKAQLRKLGEIKLLLLIIYVFAKLLFFLRPSFYVLAKYDKKLKI